MRFGLAGLWAGVALAAAMTATLGQHASAALLALPLAAGVVVVVRDIRTDATKRGQQLAVLACLFVAWASVLASARGHSTRATDIFMGIPTILVLAGFLGAFAPRRARGR
jgi:hypothetical protein